jgi:hypothetical protein
MLEIHCSIPQLSGDVCHGPSRQAPFEAMTMAMAKTKTETETETKLAKKSAPLVTALQPSPRDARHGRQAGPLLYWRRAMLRRAMPARQLQPGNS